MGKSTYPVRSPAVHQDGGALASQPLRCVGADAISGTGNQEGLAQQGSRHGGEGWLLARAEAVCARRCRRRHTGASAQLAS